MRKGINKWRREAAFFNGSKYHNQKIEIDGHMFDSKKEARRYQELSLLQKAGEIRDLKLQPEFVLIPCFKKGGRTYRKTSFIADFMYFDCAVGKTIVEDVKGYKTDVYRLKKKLFEFRYPEYSLKET
ncbi:MAG: DUF1064 domain-containing protein [Lachnospiraceae bacterium]|nr:DUF1064 domain-containing protein [Lachnospiraceae bacterium]